jgi:hypothetical protein
MYVTDAPEILFIQPLKALDLKETTPPIKKAAKEIIFRGLFFKN